MVVVEPIIEDKEDRISVGIVVCTICRIFLVDVFLDGVEVVEDQIKVAIAEKVVIPENPILLKRKVGSCED